jgi:endonuclease YncB( thermonuclease family)
MTNRSTRQSQNRLKYPIVGFCAFLGFAILIAGSAPASAGDSIYGRIAEVRSANSVVLQHGGGRFNIRIAGIELPRQKAPADRAKEFLQNFALGKNARLRLGYRERDGTFVGRVHIDDPDKGIKDVAIELVRAGLVRKQANFDYKYGELAAAEREAREAKRGLWGGR